MGLDASVTWLGGVTHVSGIHTAAGRIGDATGFPVGKFVTTDGNGVGQANQVFSTPFSILTGAFQLYDLKSGNGELDILNVALAMTAVKLVLVELDTPAAANSILFGPQAQTNAALLWFQAATANFYDTVLERLMQCDARAGWALDGTHKVIALKNPGAQTVTGKLLVVGTK